MASDESAPERPRAGRVLIVDDDPDIRNALASAIESEGIPTEIAENGRDALDRLAAADRPCLILLDLMMPVMTGLEFLEAVRRDGRFADVPVVVVSAYEKLAAGAGTTGHLKKPIELDDLLSVVTRHCSKPALRVSNSEARI